MPTNPLIFDGHNDTLLDLFDAPRKAVPRTFFKQAERGHIDLPRARAGGLGGGFFAIFVPNRFRKGHPRPKPIRTAEGEIWPLVGPVEQPYALEYTIRMASHLFRLEEESAGRFKVVRSAAEVEECLRNGVLAAILHAEGAEFIDPHLHALDVLAAAGLKSLGLVWSRANAFGTGVPFNFPGTPDIGPGLTEAGQALVRCCNGLRVLIDLSHLNEAGFWDVERLTDAPLVATHSGAHACSATPRNLTDRQLDAIGKSGGIVGVNFHKGFLRADGNAARKTSVDEIARHARYIADRIGVDHVGLGSDFDGASMPEDLRDAAGLPRLLDALRAQGFDEPSLRKIAHENWVRVLRATWGA
jgi:membrane dipeptidase